MHQMKTLKRAQENLNIFVYVLAVTNAALFQIALLSLQVEQASLEFNANGMFSLNFSVLLSVTF